MKSKHLLLPFLALMLTVACYAQPKVSLNTIQNAMDSARNKLPAERVYMQFDKPSYVLGDTMWFKAYIFNASFLNPSAQSGILHIDVFDEDSKIVQQFMLPVAAGTSWGNLALTNPAFNQGAYTLRAYTNWMRNAGDDNFFYYHFNMISSAAKTILVNTSAKLSTVNNQEVVKTALQFTSLNGQPIASKNLQLTLARGTKKLLGNNITTNQAGIASINFTLPRDAMQVNLIAEDKATAEKTIIPLALTLPENTDIQFMPEGGNLVAGIPTKVGFKAIGEDGHAVNISGIIISSSNTQVASFNSTHKGMGSFYFTPAAGQVYTARVSLPNGYVKNVILPAVQQNGILLSVQNSMDADSIELQVTATKDFARANGNVMLVAQASDVFCYGAILRLQNQQTITRRLAKNLFPMGVARLTVLSTTGQPLTQRLTFIRGNNNMLVNINTNKNSYGIRDSVAVSLLSNSQDSTAIQGNFSIAVTDDAQVKSNSAFAPNIVTSILLSPDIKGYIEEPAWYLQTGDSTVWQALDNLLLTQGWAAYNWQQVLAPSQPAFQPEHAFTITGKVSNLFNKGVATTPIILLSQNPTFVADTVSDNKGNFVFTNFPALDTPRFVLQARNKRGKSFNVGIDVDKVQPPVYNPPPAPAITPWYINTDTTLLAQAAARQQLDKKLMENMTLAPVTVYGKKTVAGSQNLNGSGNADQVIDEAEVEKAGKMSLFELVTEKVSGFAQNVWPPLNITHSVVVSKPDYLINGKQVKLIFDGISVDEFYYEDNQSGFESRDKHLQFIKSYLEYYRAEDIKGIEVLYSTTYNYAYNNTYLYRERKNPMNVNVAAGYDFAYLEITTRSGKGPFYKPTPGVYVYKSVPFSWPAKFYSPRYTVKDSSNNSVDLRSTIYWQPNVITGTDGKAALSFYTADKPGSYTITVEGTDFNGNVAVKTKKIIVTANAK